MEDLWSRQQSSPIPRPCTRAAHPEGDFRDLGQTEVSLRLGRTGDQSRDLGGHSRNFSSTRDGYDAICQIISGTATIAEADGSTFQIGPGSLFVTPAGWEGTWTVHETLRKMWVVADIHED